MAVLILFILTAAIQRLFREQRAGDMLRHAVLTIALGRTRIYYGSAYYGSVWATCCMFPHTGRTPRSRMSLASASAASCRTTTYYLLRTTYYVLLTTYYLLLAAYGRLPAGRR